jgi:hypothetical protein
MLFTLFRNLLIWVNLITECKLYYYHDYIKLPLLSVSEIRKQNKMTWLVFCILLVFPCIISIQMIQIATRPFQQSNCLSCEIIIENVLDAHRKKEVWGHQIKPLPYLYFWAATLLLNVLYLLRLFRVGLQWLHK